MFQVAFAGLTHDHVWGEVPAWLDQPGVDIIAACDPNVALTDRFTEETGVTTTFASVDDMLNDIEPTILHINTSNFESAQIAERALTSGIHVVLEKPLAANFEQAEGLLETWRHSPAKLMINWKDWWSPSYQLAAQMVEKGAIGKVQRVQCRMGHAGPRRIGCSPYFVDWLLDPVKNGGGVMVDYGCYGILAALHYLGFPEEISATGVTVRPDQHGKLDDNAVITMNYSHGQALAIASWTQSPPERQLELQGDLGTIWVTDRNLEVQTAESERLSMTPTDQDIEFHHAAEYMVHCLQNDSDIKGAFSPEFGFNTQFLLDAALKSFANGQSVTLNN